MSELDFLCLLHHDRAAVDDIEALPGRLALELAAVEVVPNGLGIHLNGSNTRGDSVLRSLDGTLQGVDSIVDSLRSKYSRKMLVSRKTFMTSLSYYYS